MNLWRVSNHAALDGRGGLYASGRWHTQGSLIIYCAPNPATALLEILVHAEVDIEDIPAALRYLEIDAPDDIPVESVNIASLGTAWWRNARHTQRLGDDWLRGRRTAVLRVPSVVAPATSNVLINPLHPDVTRVRIVRVHEHRVDERLLR